MKGSPDSAGGTFLQVQILPDPLNTTAEENLVEAMPFDARIIRVEDQPAVDFTASSTGSALVTTGVLS